MYVELAIRLAPLQRTPVVLLPLQLRVPQGGTVLCAHSRINPPPNLVELVDTGGKWKHKKLISLIVFQNYVIAKKRLNNR
jgi:hypothetical protein